jgi:hypothetical protein
MPGVRRLSKCTGGQHFITMLCRLLASLCPSHITPWTWHCYNGNVALGLWFRAGTGRVLSCFRLAGSPSSPKGCAKTPSVPRNATRHCTGIILVPKSRRDGRAFAIDNNARAIPKTPLSSAALALAVKISSRGLKNLPPPPTSPITDRANQQRDLAVTLPPCLGSLGQSD